MTAVATNVPPIAPASNGRQAVRFWLRTVAALVFAMVIVGGATRLTGSGLSITEWKPLLGALPPLSHADWEAAFAKYREIPQFSVANRDMTLAGFQFIFWWEWAHRFLGRFIGAAFLLPFLVFLATGRIRRSEVPTFAGLFLLGGLQGAVGWWMVASGLVDRIDVAPYRLAIHLTLACLIFVALVWTAERLDATNIDRRPRASWLATLLIPAVLIQIFLGALVAGNDAGLVYNTWPSMNGDFVPPDVLTLQPVWRNFFENHATVQFVHRLGAYAVFVLALTEAIGAWRGGRADIGTAMIVALIAIAQAGIGIATLLLIVPMPLALLHQAGAIVLLTAVVVHRARLRG